MFTIDNLTNPQKICLLKNFKRYCSGELTLGQLATLVGIEKLDAHDALGSIKNLPYGNPYVV